MRTISTTIVTFILLLALSATAQDWARVANVPQTSFTALEVIDGTIYAASGNKLYFSHDHGARWETIVIAPEFLEPGYFKKFGGRLYVGMHGQGIYSASLDQLQGPWTKNIGVLVVSSFAEFDGSLYVSTLGYGIYKLNPNQSWSPFMNGLPTYSYNVSKILATPRSLMAPAGGNGTFYRYNFTNHLWEEDYYYTNFLPGLIIDDAILSNNNLYVSNGRRLLRSSDNGNNWMADQLGLPSGLGRFLYQGERSLYAFTAQFNPANNDNFTYLRKRSLSAPPGSSWDNASDFLPFYVYAIGESGNRIFAAGHNGLYFKTDATLGTEQPVQAQDGIVIHPNPSPSGAFTLSSSKAIDALEVYDLTGKLLSREKQVSDSYHFSVPRQGIYLVKAITGDTVRNIKIIAQP